MADDKAGSTVIADYTTGHERYGPNKTKRSKPNDVEHHSAHDEGLQEGSHDESLLEVSPGALVEFLNCQKL